MYKIWGVDLAGMQVICKYNKKTCFWLCAIHAFSKYASVIPLKEKIGEIIPKAYQKN